MPDLDLMRRRFEEIYGPGPEPRQFFAPGRVNLIGEHIDYNGGLVFPAALTIGIMALVRYRADRLVRLASLDLPGGAELDLSGPIFFNPEVRWSNYPAGVIELLRQAGKPVPGADVLYAGDLPDGGGLSSSAAIEVLTGCLMIDPTEGEAIDRVELARLCQQAENRFVGVNCGIMDQFAVAMGRRDHAILLDCATLGHRYVPARLPGHTLVVMNTNRKRGLADSKYNQRRAECDRALELVRRLRPVDNLCQATPGEVEAAIDDPVLLRRARHVTTEQRRVEQAVAALETGDLVSFGELLVRSHASLRDDYEVTGPHLDAIAAEAQSAPGCLGARMTGAGFGGCAVALVREPEVAAFIGRVTERYRERTGLQPDLYPTMTGPGAGRVDEG